MAKPIMGMIPPSGYHYMESDVRLNGTTLDDLYSVVTNFRAENNIPQGHVEEDVNDYICANWPNFCHNVDRVTINAYGHATAATDELMSDIQVWARNLLGANRERVLVGDEVAEARAVICRSCPKNVNWRGGCSSCITATDRLCASVRQARDTKSTAVLGGCQALRHDNRTAVFLQTEELASSSSIPAACWLNK